MKDFKTIGLRGNFTKIRITLRGVNDDVILPTAFRLFNSRL
jgi:hypothetical protein